MRLISETWFHSEVSSEQSLSSLPSFKRPTLLQLNLVRLTLRTRVDPFWYQDWTSPYYNDSHKKVRRAIREFTGSFLPLLPSLSLSLSSLSPRPPSELNLICPVPPGVDTYLTPNAYAWDQAKEIPPSEYKRIADHGILCAIAAGGTGWPDEEYSKGIPVPGGIKKEEWDAFHSTFSSSFLSLSSLSLFLFPLDLFVTGFSNELLTDKKTPSCFPGMISRSHPPRRTLSMCIRRNHVWTLGRVRDLDRTHLGIRE